MNPTKLKSKTKKKKQKQNGVNPGADEGCSFSLFFLNLFLFIKHPTSFPFAIEFC
jgi:hypothetical protein